MYVCTSGINKKKSNANARLIKNQQNLSQRLELIKYSNIRLPGSQVEIIINIKHMKNQQIPLNLSKPWLENF